jgi:mono/diheme cytochrome c family protein
LTSVTSWLVTTTLLRSSASTTIGYVLNHCHFCHGTDLTQAAMGATDLMHGALVGADENGNLIGAVVRAGRPNLQTAMPRYDLSATEITELAAYIHFLRRSGRHRELTDPAAAGSGDAATGEAYFQRRCAACHAVRGDLAGIARKYPVPALRARVLRPIPETGSSSSDSPGRLAHERLLEQYSDADLRDLLSYLDRATR